MKYILAILLFSLQARAQEVPSDWEFIVLKTDHFDIIVNAGQQDLGHLYAEKLEQAYDFLNPLFTDKPERTIVIINDRTDITNGWATKIPYSHIMAFPVLPGPTESLSESGDWALELLAHEYTHILTFEPAGGFFKFLRYGFGTIISPNILLPRWWKEGVAVHIESQISRGGRLRSIYQDAIIRSFVKSKRIWDFDLSEINEAIPTWPEGHRPYLFGSLMWNQMVGKKGDKIVDTLHQRHGRRFPYFIEAPARDHLGQSYVEQFNSVIMEADIRAKKQIKQLESKKLSELDWLDLKTEYLNHPSISVDGRYMAIISVDETNKREVKLLERKGNQTFNQSDSFKKIESFKEDQLPPTPQDGPPTGSIQRVSWFHKKPRLIYDKIDSINRIERYSDLHVYDLQSQKSESLTTGLRGREPSVSPDDSEVAFVKLSGGKTALATLNLGTKEEKILWESPLQYRISYPTYLDQNRIIYSLRTPESEEKLWILDRTTGQRQSVLVQFKNARFPTLTSQGLLFTSSNNGVHNLYLADSQLKSARAVSHVLTSAFAPAWDPIRQDIYASVMSEKGPQVARIPAEDWKLSREPLPVIEGLYADRYPADSKIPEKKTNVVRSQEDYSSLTKLWPHYWIPSIFTSTVDNNLVVAASTSGHDPLKKHVYSVTGMYETGLQRGSILGVYQNNQSPWPVLLHSSEMNSYLYSVDNLLTQTNVTLSVWPDIFPLNRYSLLEIGGKYNRVDYSDTRVTRHGTTARFVYANYSKSGAQISPESGQSFYLGATNYHYNTDDIKHTAYVFGGSYYHSRWLPERHAIMLKANGFHVDEIIAPIYGAHNNIYMPYQDFPVPLYVMRGYATGQFVGRKLYNMNLEYRFPIQNIYWGRGSDAYFLHRLHGAVTVDGIATHGLAYNRKNDVFESVDLDRKFWSYGLEARLETSVGYILPINVILGAYTVPDDQYAPKVSGGLNLQAGTTF